MQVIAMNHLNNITCWLHCLHLICWFANWEILILLFYSQKEKLALFAQISECIQSSALRTNVNYLGFVSNAVSILLMFCEDIDSVVRMRYVIKRMNECHKLAFVLFISVLKKISIESFDFRRHQMSLESNTIYSKR